MRVLVCDDEIVIRKGIKSMLEKKFSNIEVSLCKNGQEALEEVKETTFDLVITDIQMPEMDGLSFIKSIHESHRELPIIVISGYDYFEYAIEALRYGVKEYLLKPVERNKLYEAIEKIQLQTKGNMILNHEERELISKLNVKLVQQTKDDLKIYKSVHFIQDSYYVSVCRDVKREEIQKLLEEKSSYFFFERTDEEGILFTKDKPQFSCLQHGIIGISSLKSGHNQIHIGYEEAIQATQDKFFWPNRHVFTYEVLEEKWPSPLEEVERIIRYIGTNRDEEMLALFKTITDFNQLKKFPIYYTKIIHDTLITILHEKDLISYLKNVETYTCLEQFKLFNTYEDWKESWNQFLKNLSLVIYSKTGTQYYISRSLEYIDKHYNQDITLAMVSNYVSLNYSYLSALFKEHVGKSFGNYVRSLRIDKAKVYLKEEHLKVYEIAELVGYQDAKQFTKTFRKLTGVSPQEYREKNRVLQSI